MADESHAQGKRKLRIPLECVLFAGLGGTMPTLARYASALSSGAEAPLLAWDFWAALALFFVMGSIIAYVLCPERLARSKMLQQAFALGLAAPGIILSWGSGSSETAASSRAPQAEEDPLTSPSISLGAAGLPLLPSAHGGEAPAARPITGPSVLILVDTVGARAQQVGAVPVTIRFLTEGGEAVGSRAYSLIGSRSLRVPVPRGSRKVELVAHDSTRVVDLPRRLPESTTIRYRLEIKGEIGFWWALGGARRSKVSGASAFLVAEPRPPEPPVAPQPSPPRPSPRDVLGVEVKDADGNVIGVIEEVRVGKQADRAVVKTKEGGKRELPMDSLEKAANGLRIKP